ncbi:copia protein [Tanacetum coccineum]
MGMIDNTLFTKKTKSHLIIVQIYVDDIIFGSTCQNLCDDFGKIMHDEFEMSMMGVLNFFLGLQIKQMEDEIFFNQSKYIKEMLKKFGLEDSKPTKTPMSMEIKLTKGDEADSVDSTKYRVIKNGATLPKIAVVEGVEKVMPITSAEDKARRRLEDAKLLLEAIEKRFGRNATTKKTQRNLLKQQYENFVAPSSEMLDQTFDRIQKLVSQLVLLDEKLSQEDVNQKLLRSLSPEWNTHAVVDEE